VSFSDTMSISDIIFEVILFGGLFSTIGIIVSISRQDRRNTRTMAEACRIARAARRKAKSKVN
jgi:hypothetical protein